LKKLLLGFEPLQIFFENQKEEFQKKSKSSEFKRPRHTVDTSALFTMDVPAPPSMKRMTAKTVQKTLRKKYGFGTTQIFF
jgi:hypothetical protein